MTEQLQDVFAGLSDEQRELLALRLRHGEPARPVAPPEPGGPASATQRQLWFLDRLDPGNPAYNVPFAVRLTGRLDRATLEVALGDLVRRHEPLRTVFEERD